VIFTRLGGRQMARTDFGLNCLLSRQLYVILTRLGGHQMARTDFGLNCLLSRQFLKCFDHAQLFSYSERK
jgi:hypothetical protein